MRRLLAAAVLLAALGTGHASAADPDPGAVLAWSQTTIDGLSTLTLAGSDGSLAHRVNSRLTILGRPAVGPHGEGIVVSGPNGHETGYYGLDLVQPNGSRRTLTRPRSAADEDPAWSPDGSRIAAVRTSGYPGSGADRLVVLSPGGPARVLPFVKGNLHDPAWSPDGTSLAYTDDHGLETVRVDGGHPMLQVRASGLSQPSWYPDGTSWAVIGPKHGGLQLMWAYKKHAHPLGRFVGSVDSPAWDSDGTGLLALTYRGFGDSGRSGVSLIRVNTKGIVTRIRGLPNSAHDLSRGSLTPSP